MLQHFHKQLTLGAGLNPPLVDVSSSRVATETWGRCWHAPLNQYMWKETVTYGELCHKHPALLHTLMMKFRWSHIIHKVGANNIVCTLSAEHFTAVFHHIWQQKRTNGRAGVVPRNQTDWVACTQCQSSSQRFLRGQNFWNWDQGRAKGQSRCRSDQGRVSSSCP